MINDISIREYQVSAGDTDMINEKQFKENHYYVLGSSGENGEIADKVAKIYRKYTDGIKPSDTEIEDTMLELSDVSWYFVRELFALEGITKSVDTANELQELAKEEICFSITELAINVLELTAIVGAISDATKKIVRDRCNHISEEYVEFVKEKCRVGLSKCAVIAANLGYNYSDVLKANIAKLASRKARNVLNGSGDRR